jgi:hypothetical protein
MCDDFKHLISFVKVSKHIYEQVRRICNPGCCKIYVKYIVKIILLVCLSSLLRIDGALI